MKIEDTLLERIDINPEIMLGKPVIKGTRLPVELIVEKIAYGEQEDKILEDYPFINREDIRASLLYAAKTIAREEIFIME